jgi:hypothetical protein
MLPAERMAAELERSRQGTFIQMPREEFEGELRHAQLAGSARSDPPRLTEARYRASLVDGALVGTGTWTLTCRRPGIFPLEPFNLALRSARLDNSRAVLGDLGGQRPGLLLETAGTHCLQFTWSARGEPAFGAARFELRIPACTLTSFELELPASMAPIVGRERALLVGPEPGVGPDRRLWHLRGRAETPLDVLIRPTSGEDGRVPLLLSRLETRQVLGPDRLDADFQFTLDVLHRPICQLVCEYDPTLRPTEVTLRKGNLQSWELAGGSVPRLIVQLREPVEGEALGLRVRCVAATRLNERWTCPGMVVAGSVSLGETLRLQIAPELRLEAWQPGNFSLTGAGRPLVRDAQTITLRSGIVGVQGSRVCRRPSALLQLRKAECQVIQQTRWDIRPNVSTLTTRLAYEVRRGRLFRLPIQIPAGWEVDRVDPFPSGLLRGWTVAAKAMPVVTLDLDRPLEAGGTAIVTLVLRPAPAPPSVPGTSAPAGQETSLPFPLVIPQQALLITGTFAISLDPSFEAQVTCSFPALRPGLDRVRDLFGSDRAGPPASMPARAPDYEFAYRNTPPTGAIRLSTRQTRVFAECTSEVVLAPAGLTMRTRLALRPDVGAPEAIELYLSPGSPTDWKWRTAGGSSVRAVQRQVGAEVAPMLLPLGAGSPLSAAAELAQPPDRGTRWRVLLAQPLREPAVLEALFDLGSGQAKTSPGPERRWQVPLLMVLQPAPTGGELRLHVADTDRVRVEAVGLREVATGSRDGAGPWRTFRYTSPPFSLVVGGRSIAPDRPAGPIAEGVELTTFVAQDDRVLHRFAFRIRGWDQQSLPLRMPSGTEALAARVEGRWLASPATGQSEDGSLLISLPVPEGANTHAFEVYYTSQGAVGRLWTSLEAPEPRLPLDCLTFRRTWCLGAGLTPWDEATLLRLPGCDQAAAAVPIPGRIDWNWSFARSASADDGRLEQQKLLAAAEVSLRALARTHPDLSLGGMVNHLVFEVFRERQALVIDAAALADEGLSAASSVPPERPSPDTLRIGQNSLPRPLNSLGLICLPCRPASLLTTIRQWQAWAGNRSGASPVPASVEEAMAQAAQHGQDPSGRFRGALAWLRAPAEGRQAEEKLAGRPGVAVVPGTVARRAGPWTVWEPRAGASASRLVIVRSGGWWQIVLIACGVFLVLFTQARCWPGRVRYALLLGWLGASALAAAWLPPGLLALTLAPGVTGAGAALLWYLGRALRATSARRLRQPALAATLALTLALALPAGAVAPAPQIVWLLPDARGKQSVLVGAELLEQIRTLARRGMPGLREVVLLRAQYDGTVGGEVALQATLDAYALDDGPMTLHVPLGGVELREVTLDGAPAFPAAATPPQVGFTLQVKGRGEHRAVLRFAVPLGGTSDGPELRCAIPEVAASHLALRLPTTTSAVHAVAARGSQQVTAGASDQLLEADLGRIPFLHVRWRQQRPPREPALLHLRELYFWQLQAPASRLVGALQYQVMRGAVTELRLGLPEGMEVRRVEVAALVEGGALPRLRDWQLVRQTGQRQLRLALTSPVANGLTVFLDLVASTALGPDAALALPTLEDTTPTDGLLGCQGDEVRLSLAEYRRVTGIEPDAFLDAWQATGAAELTRPQFAYRFRRTQGGPPVLRLHLAPLGRQPRWHQNLTWQLGPHQADLQALAEVESNRRDLQLIEWQIPAEIQVVDVAGADVRDWSRAGSLLQVWLRQSVRRTSLQLTGWVARPHGPTTPFTLPCLRPLEASAATTLLWLNAEAPETLQADRLDKLRPLPDATVSPASLSYGTDQLAYGGTFRSTAAVTVDVATLTSVEALNREIEWVGDLDYRIHSGELRTVRFQLRGWPGQEVRLEAPQLAGQRETSISAGERHWELELRPGVTDRYHVRLRGTMPLAPSGEFSLPHVVPEGIPAAAGWLLARGPAVEVVKTLGVRSAPELPDPVRVGAAAEGRPIRREDLVWQVEATDWDLRLRWRDRQAENHRARVLLDEQSAEVGDGRHWLHQATYWLYHPTGVDVVVRLPAGAEAWRATLDGSPLPVPAGRRPIWVPLPGTGQPSRLCLGWAFAPADEPLEHPNLERPQLEGVEFVPAATNAPTCVWVIGVPPGFRIDPEHRATSAPPGIARDLHRAAALYQLTAAIMNDRTGPNSAAPDVDVLGLQRRFYRMLRAVELQLALHGSTSQPADDAARLSTRLEYLSAANLNLAARQGFEKTRLQAEKEAATWPDGDAFKGKAALPDRGPTASDAWPGPQGTPVCFESPNDAVPQLRIVPLRAHPGAQALGLAALILVCVLDAWLLHYHPRLAGVLLALWPEQLILVGLVTWYVLGPNLLSLSLIFVGLLARLSLLRRRAPAVPEERSPAEPSAASAT